MNRNVTASFGLSVLIVIFFAVALYQPDRPTARLTQDEPVRPTGPVVSGAPERRAVPDAEPESRTVAVAEPEPRREPVVTPPAPAAVRSGSPAVTPVAAGSAVSVARRSVRTAGAPVTRPVARRTPPAPLPPPPRPPARNEPRGEFTVARDGESLRDVARRVYGTRVDAATLWRANRDILDTADSPLRSGTLLRTPHL